MEQCVAASLCSFPQPDYVGGQATLRQEERVCVLQVPTSHDRLCGAVRCIRNSTNTQWGGATAALAESLLLSSSPLGKSAVRRPLCEEDYKVGTLQKLLCEEGDISTVIEELDLLVQRGCHVAESVYYRVLKMCMARKDLVLGMRVHTLALKSGYESNAFLANHLIVMYSSHRRLEQASQVFTKVAAPNVYVWASIILAHARHGRPTDAIKLYRQMRESTVKPDDHIFVAVLKACATAADLAFGKEVHADIVGSAGRLSLFVGNCLVEMYSKCGSLEDALKVFESLPTRDVVTWTAMIAGYAQHGLVQEALALYANMQQVGMALADRVTFLCLLKACASTGALLQGQQLHAQIQERGLEADVAVGSCLVAMYAKCGSLEDARRVFDRLLTKNAVTWTALIAGYAEHGLVEEALTLYAGMQQDGMAAADHVTFVCLLQACASVGALHEGEQLHSQIWEKGLDTDLVIGNSLVNMYCKCGSLKKARSVFDRLPAKDVVTWTAIIGGYSQHGLGREALALYATMQQEGMNFANDVTFVCLLQACASVGDLDQGKQLHTQVQERGLEADMVVGSSLVDMYAKCGRVEDARTVFDKLHTRNVVTWNAMIGAYAQHELGQEALALYACMQGEGVTRADHITYAYLLQACASVGAFHQGKQLHEQIKQEGLEDDVLISSCLVDMYAKCGALKDARRVFDRLPTRDVVTWTAMLNGYAEHSDGEMAMQFFEEMQQQGVTPDGVTFSCLLVACSHQGLVKEGQRYFRTMVKYGIKPTVYHYSCMVDLLGRSGHLDEAENMLRSNPLENDVVGWTSLLSACKRNGDIERGERCFKHLINLEPENSTAYVLLANIYAYAGRWRDVDRIENLRKCAGAKKKAAKACIEVQQKVHEFTVGEQRADISSKWKRLNMMLKEDGHVPQTELVLKSVTEEEKEDALCGHAEKLALAYGLLNTPVGTPLLVTKNLRMCDDCHHGTKIMSRLENRAIIVRDSHRLHRFVDGSCSCGDRH